MNRRQLFLSSAKGALLGALGAVGFRTSAQASSRIPPDRQPRKLSAEPLQ